MQILILERDGQAVDLAFVSDRINALECVKAVVDQNPQIEFDGDCSWRIEGTTLAVALFTRQELVVRPTYDPRVHDEPPFGWQESSRVQDNKLLNASETIKFILDHFELT